jgi:hypothetical protein
MRLSPGVTIVIGDTVTATTLYDLVGSAYCSAITTMSDFDTTNLYEITTQSVAPTPKGPGDLWYDQTSQLMKLWVDVLDGTGVSLWMAIGPDRWDMPVYATEAIPYGAAVQLQGVGRSVCLPTTPTGLEGMGAGYRQWELAKVVGFNNGSPYVSPATAASGTWFACAMEGWVWAWYPARKGPTTFKSSAGVGTLWDSLIAWNSNTTFCSGTTDVRGGLMSDVDQNALQTGKDAQLLLSIYSFVSATNSAGQHALRFWSGARVGTH